MLDFGGFLASDEFLIQIALILTTLLSTLVTGIIGKLFGGV